MFIASETRVLAMNTLVIKGICTVPLVLPVELEMISDERSAKLPERFLVSSLRIYTADLCERGVDDHRKRDMSVQLVRSCRLLSLHCERYTNSMTI